MIEIDTIYYDAYSTINQTISGTTPVVINFDTERPDVPTGNFNNTLGEISVNRPDTYLINYRVSVDNNGGNRRVAISYLEIDDGTGFTEVPGTRSFTYHRNNTDGQNTSGSSVILPLTNSDTIRVVAIKEDTGSGEILETVENGSSIILTPISGIKGDSGETGPQGATGSNTGFTGPIGPTGPASLPAPTDRFAKIYDEKPTGTNGQPFGFNDQTGVNVRDLNVIEANNTGIVLNGDNSFSIPTGEWLIDAFAPAGNTDAHRIYLNSSDGLTPSIRINGSSAFNTNTSHSGVSILKDILILPQTRTFQILHNIEGSNGLNTGGTAVGTPNIPEIYTTVTLLKL
jgi:hypothetical protein